MAEYARVVAGNVVELRQFAAPPPNMSRKGFVWLPVEVTDPPFNPTTQLRSGPVVTVEVDKVTRVWTVVDMTSQELDDRKQEQVDQRLVVTPMDKALLTLIFNMLNDVRVLKGQGTITLAQFKNALKGLM